jgi:bifunctional N-acetylglucosamine-1-phosphate-uridyltransferase/glucosamine-1-phosphate-acetyltransferase GlmU-like protein
MLAAPEFFDLDAWTHRELFTEAEPVWLVLNGIKPYLARVLEPNVQELHRYGPVLRETVILHEGSVLTTGFDVVPGDATKGKLVVTREGQELEGATVVYAGACLMGEDIVLGRGSLIEPGALIRGPVIIGSHCEIRQGAYIRGHCVVGDRCVVGHATEIKHSVMMDDAKAGHFAYIGDSILGNRTNLGAGTKLANLKMVSTPVTVKVGGERWDTGLRKFGAIIGDDSETGCNSVTNPGTVLGRRCVVCPCVSVKSGYFRERSVIR